MVEAVAFQLLRVFVLVRVVAVRVVRASQIEAYLLMLLVLAGLANPTTLANPTALANPTVLAVPKVIVVPVVPVILAVLVLHLGVYVFDHRSRVEALVFLRGFCLCCPLLLR